MLYLPVIVLMDGLHNQVHQFGRFTAKFRQVHIQRIIRTIDRTAIMDKVLHLNIEAAAVHRHI